MPKCDVGPLAEWLKLLNFYHLQILTNMGLISFILLCEEATCMQLAYGMLVVLFGCPLMPKIMH